MFAFFTTVNQPDIHAVPINIHSEFAGIDELLLLPTAAAAMKHSDRTTALLLRYFSHLVRKVTDLGNAAHEKLPKSANGRLPYGNFGAEITYLCTVIMLPCLAPKYNIILLTFFQMLIRIIFSEKR